MGAKENYRICLTTISSSSSVILFCSQSLLPAINIFPSSKYLLLLYTMRYEHIMIAFKSKYNLKPYQQNYKHKSRHWRKAKHYFLTEIWKHYINPCLTKLNCKEIRDSSYSSAKQYMSPLATLKRKTWVLFFLYLMESLGKEVKPQEAIEKSKYLKNLYESFGFMCIHISKGLISSWIQTKGGSYFFRWSLHIQEG